MNRPILRQCVACREYRPRETLFRVTYNQRTQQYSLDGIPRLEGRSAYVCRQKTCLQQTLKGKKLQRSLKRVVSDDILSYLNRALEGLDS